METFSALSAICAGNSPATGGQWRGALMFSLICVWINGWVNNREADDLRRYRAHYDVSVMCVGSGMWDHYLLIIYDSHKNIQIWNRFAKLTSIDIVHKSLVSFHPILYSWKHVESKYNNVLWNILLFTPSNLPFIVKVCETPRLHA